MTGPPAEQASALRSIASEVSRLPSEHVAKRDALYRRLVSIADDVANGGRSGEAPAGLTNEARIALAAAKSASSDGRDTGPNTVAVLVSEIERLTSSSTGGREGRT